MEQEEQHFYYSPFTIIYLFLIFLVLIIMSGALFIIFLHKKSLAILLPITFFLLGYSYLFYTARALVALIKGKPAIVLTPAAYQDNYYGITMKWEDIKNIDYYYFSFGRRNYLRLQVVSLSRVYRQVSDPITKGVLLLSAKCIGGKYFTIIDQVKGKGHDILKQIQDYQGKVAGRQLC